MAMNIDAAVNISADVAGQQAVEKLAESLKKVGETGAMSAKQIEQQMRYLPKQFDDLFRQIAAGQSPMQAFYMQGSQLRDMFGGLGPAIGAVGRYLGSIVTPFTAAAAVAAAFGYALYSGAEQSKELNKQLTLTGGAAGYTAGQLEQMSHKLSDTAGITAGLARDLTTGLAASGVFVGKNLDAASEAAAKLQKLTGQTSDEVVKDFAKMDSGVAAWAAEHNKAFNYLSVAQFQHIKQLDDMGHHEEAMALNIAALDKAMAERQQTLGTLQKAWDGITRAASAAWDAMLHVGREETPEEKLDKMKARLAEMAQAGGMRKGLFGEMIIDPDGDAKLLDQEFKALQDAIAKQQALVDKSHADAEAKAKKAAETRKQIQQIQSGQEAALQNADIALQLEKLKGASEKRIALLEEEGQKVENQYRAGVLSEEDYNDKKLSIAKSVLQERMKLAEQEMALENKRPANNQVDLAQRQVKLQQLRNQMAQFEAESNAASLKAEGDRAAFLRSMDDAVAKFTRTQQAKIDQIEQEAAASRMSTLEYKEHTEALRIDKEAADAAAGKSPEWVAKIMAEASAMKVATNAALEKADADKRAFGTGARDAMKDYIENVNNAATQAKTLFTDAFKGMEDALVNFVKTGQLDFSALADSIITDMIRIQVQRSILGPLMGTGKNGDYGVMGDLASSVQSFFGFANGGIMTSSGALPLNKYANGGVANSPQLALFGEGKTPEAYVPLPDGRNIPVKMQNGGGGGNVVVNVVNNASGAQAKTQERQDSNGQRIIDVVIEQVKASIASDISRGVGTVTSALERTYGANRAAGAY